MRYARTIIAAIALTLLANGVLVANAANDCVFDTVGDVMALTNSCTTDSTIVIPDGMTLDGANHTITAVDPVSGHFLGAVVANGGNTAHVTSLTVTASGLANVCDAGDDRLRGILFEGAGGSITHSTVTGINQGPSGCQEGNAIEVRNAPFDGNHPNTMMVGIRHNTITDWMKTGIVANGDVDVNIQNNNIGESATQENLAANSVQFGFGATGSATLNQVDGNQWMGLSDFAATAFLVYLSNGVTIENNNIGGNSDIAIYFFGDNGSVVNNRVFDVGDDHPNSHYDIGIGDWGTGNTVTNNKVRGFDTPLDGADEDSNVIIPSPNN